MLGTLITVLFLTESTFSEITPVEYYVDLITKTQSFARYYQSPTDARKYYSAPQRSDFGEYNFIVIGAGSAGSVVANRLSEIQDWNVLVIEAGTFENDFVDIPSMNLPAQFTDYNWGFNSTPQETVCLGMVNRMCPEPRGRGVGGSSLINALVYARGNPGDFDRWAADGNPGWSYRDVLPYFKKSENVSIPNADFRYHGQNGPLNVEYRRPLSPQLNAFLEANVELGKKILDYNGRQQLGASAAQVNTINGRRHSTGGAFIKPILQRPNLKILTEAYATKILIDKNKRAYGVEFSYKHKRLVAIAKSEVILCAGAIGSPHILLLSGIGPKRELKRYDIKLVNELNVGKHLLNHPTFYGFMVETNYSEPAMCLRQQVEQYLNGEGPLTMPGNNQGIGFYRTSLAKQNVPDLEMLMVPAVSIGEFNQKGFHYTGTTAQALWGEIDPSKTFMLTIIALGAISEGDVTLKSSDPFDYPQIDSRYLSDPDDHDIEVLYEGIQIAFEMIDTRAFRKMDARYAANTIPECEKYYFSSKDYWYCTIRHATFTIYHPMGTCRMGPDARNGAVVDHQLRVHGIKNLRVADASIFPYALSGHPNAATIMIGEVVSDLIKAQHYGEHN